MNLLQLVFEFVYSSNTRLNGSRAQVLKPGTRNTGTPTNKVSFVFDLGLELMVSG